MQIFGTTGSDTIHGTVGNDTIDADLGNDTIYGGGGADTFAFNPGDGFDIVFDFSATGRGHDTIQFTGHGAFVGGPLAHEALHDGEVIQTVTGHALTVIDYGGDTILQWDTGEEVNLQLITPRHMYADYVVSF